MHSNTEVDQLDQQSLDRKLIFQKNLEDMLQKLPSKTLKKTRKPSLQMWHLLLILGDLALLAVVLGGIWLFAAHLQNLLRAVLHSEVPWHVSLEWILLGIISWMFAVSITQSNDSICLLNCFKSVLSSICTVILASIFWFVLAGLFGESALGALCLIFLVLSTPLYIVWRMVIAEAMCFPPFRRRVVIVGHNAAGKTIENELQKKHYTSTDVLGYIDESNQALCETYGEHGVHLPLIGGRKTLRQLASSRAIDMIIMALDGKTNAELFQEAIEAAKFGIDVVPMAVVYERNTGRIPVEYVGDQWYVVLQAECLSRPLYLCWKRALDIACGLFGVALLCIATPLLAALIFLDNPGPIFYSQERVGLHGKPFWIYKFRSMYTDAESRGAVWASASDPRVTRVGRFLRSTHLDELPQLFNILKGDMSLIGPRPERAEFTINLEGKIPFYSYRLTAKPGLTGLAQVEYHYGRTRDDALMKLQYDLYYVKRQSFMLDLTILLKTVFEVLSLRGG